jgi:hypothetical protein
MSSIVFTDYPGHIATLLIVGVVTALLVCSFRTGTLHSLPILRWVFGALAIVVVLMLIVLTWNPCRVRMTGHKEQNTLLVCFDTSESMSVTDQSQSRLDQALTAFEQNFVVSQANKPNCRWYGFDSEFRPISRKNIGKQWGARSDLQTALTKLTGYAQPQQGTKGSPASSMCGVVVFTDGQVDNKQIQSYIKLQRDDCPVMIVACGDDGPVKDIEVRTVKAPVSVRVEQRYDIVAQIAALNLNAQPIEVQLWINDVLADRAPVTISQEGKPHDVRFSAHALAPGIDEVRVVADAVDGEANIHNNTRTRLVEVRADNAMRVLLYSQVPGFDIAKIRQCLTRDARVKLDFVYDAIIYPKLQKAHADRLTRFPTSAGEFNQYDLIVLGPCGFDRFSGEQITRLYNFVTKHGGSVVFLPGRQSFGLEECEIDEISALIPVDFDGPMDAVPTPGLSITEEGRDKNYSEAICHEDRGNDIEVAYASIRKKPAASTVLRCGQLALVCTHRIGRGRTAILNSRNIYQVYRGDKEDGPLFRLLGDIVTDVADRPSRQGHIEVFVRRTDDTTGLVFEGRVTDQTYAAARRATVLLELNDRITRMKEAGPGTYITTIQDFQGTSVFARVRAEHHGIYLGEKAIAMELDAVKHEMDDTRCDKDFLRALCDHVGAKYVDADKIGPETFGRFQAYRTGRQDRQLQRIWPRWWVFALLCSMLLAQWFMRRAKGLI